MRISDWSSDVCSSDLVLGFAETAVELDRGGDVTRTLAVIGRAAHAPRVQQLAVAGRRGVFEQPLVLGEERPLVAVEGLGGAEVDNKVVGLHLAEIRIERGGEMELDGGRPKDVGAKLEIAAA